MVGRQECHDRNNVIHHVAAAFNILGYDNLATSQQTQNVVISNNLVYDVSTAYHTASQVANGILAVIGAGPKDITFDHNTVDNNGTTAISFYEGTTPTGFLFTDSSSPTIFCATTNTVR